MQVWRSILDGLENGEETARKAGRWKRDHEWSLNRQRAVQILADGIQEHLDEYLDYTWDSPSKDFVKKRERVVEVKLRVEEEEQSWLTPAASPQPDDQAYASDSTLPLR